MAKIRQAIKLAVATLALASLGGCNWFGCRSCELAPAYKAPPQQASPQGLPTEIEYQPPASGIRTAALPQIPTAALVMAELNTMLGQLSAMIDQTSGEVKSIILQTQTTASQLISEMNHTLGNRVNETIDKLNESERRMVEDAQALAAQMQRSVSLINAGLLDSAKESLWEADIMAYNASYSLPCRDKPARLVYATPRRLRIWADAQLPGGQDNSDVDPQNPTAARELFIPVRGNYLTLRPPRATVTIGGESEERQAVVRGENNNGMVVVLNDETVRALQAIRRPTLLTINAYLGRCTAENNQTTETRSSVAIEILPPLRYQVATTITPVVWLPSAGRRVMNFHEVGSNRCNDDYRADRIWSVGPPARVVDWHLSVSSANGGSHVIRTARSGDFGVLVEARVRGAGRDCYLGVCNCRGRGWLGYSLTVNYETEVETALRPATFTATTPQSSYAFNYPASDFPPVHRKKECKYYSRVAISEGDAETIVELTDGNPVVDTQYGPVTSRHTPDCRVTVEIPPQARANLRRVS